MESGSIFLIVITGLVAIALVIFLIRRNLKDKKSLNPDAPDAVEDIHLHQEHEHRKN